MTPRERFLVALGNGMPDRIPMVIWHNKLPGGGKDETLFSLGVCLIVKSSVWKVRLSGVEVESHEKIMPDGSTRKTTRFKTPAGDLTTVERILPDTVWIEKFPFSGKKDYDALEALIESRTYSPDFEKFLEDDSVMGDRSIARPLTIHSPIHELIYEFMGMEAFSIELADNRERVLRLEKVVKNDWEKRVIMTAESPARYAVIEGNTEISVIGQERFKTFYIPCIEDACDYLHSNGKIAGAHFDGNNRRLAPLAADLPLDFIESFTPSPETDLSIREAREIWNGKALEIHFPSSVHLGGEKRIRSVGIEYLKETAPGNGFIVGVSEDLPDRGVHTLVPLFRFFHEKGELPLRM